MNGQGRVVGMARGWAPCMLGLGMLAAVGCGDDAASDGQLGTPKAPIIGSGNLVESVTEVMFVEDVRVELPFRASIYNGEERQLRLYGEDNLLSQISVDETAVGKWAIVADENLSFEQHDEIRVEVPYIEMVSITIIGEDIEVVDSPYEVWNGQEDGGMAD